AFLKRPAQKLTSITFPANCAAIKTMTFRQMAVASLNLIFAAATGFTGALAQEALPSEYQMKAAYLYNFGKFIDWPPETLPANNSPLVIGVLGNDPFEGV